MNDAISIRDVRHRYGKHPSLHGVSLAVAAGSITCLLGPSGCGKSTLLRCIAGHERLAGGAIHLGQRLLCDERNHVPPEQRHIGMVFQDYALFPHLPVWRNVAFGLRRLSTSEQRQRALAALDRFGLAELAERYPHACSGGQQQRIALARAIAPEPQALLLDEPFSGLDAGLRDQLRDDLLPVLREAGITTILVTHDPQEALACADHIALMRAGHLAQVGTPQELWHEPVDADVMAFFGPVHRIPVTIAGGRCHSPFGDLPSNLPDGAGLLVIRDEAINPDEHGIDVTVLDQQLMGAIRRSHLRLSDGSDIWIRHHDHGPLLKQCKVAVDSSQARIFPGRSDSSQT